MASHRPIATWGVRPGPRERPYRAAALWLLLAVDAWTGFVLVRSVVEDGRHGTALFWTCIAILALLFAALSTRLWRAADRWRAARPTESGKPPAA